MIVVKDDKFAPITVEEFWDSLMTVDDFVELILDRTPKDHIDDIDIHA